MGSAGRTEAVRTYNAQLLQEALRDAQNAGQRGIQVTKREADDEQNRLSGTIEGRKAAQRAALQEQQKQKEERARQAMQRQRERAEANREAAFQDALGDVLDGMTCQVGIMAEVEESLAHHRRITRTRQQALHAEWHEQVFDKIQAQIQTELAARSPHEIEARLNKLSDAYLAASGHKRGVFRDVIITADYDPMPPAGSTIAVRTRDLRDPLKRDLIKAEEERAQLSGGAAGAALRVCSALGTGRVVLEPPHWGTLAITATPHCHCVDGDGGYVVPRPDPHALAGRTSHVEMDDYTPPPPLDTTPCRVPPAFVGSGGRTDLFSVVQHRHIDGGGSIPGDDAWLNLRGRKVPPGPEQTRGRHGLADVVAHKHTHPSSRAAGGEGAHTGDMWLDARLRPRLAGPEQSRGRTDLFALMQQRPASAAAGSGDAWLEHRGKRMVDAPAAASNGTKELLDAYTDP